VTVKGYEGSVTTDAIASKIFATKKEINEDSKKLAASLATKVFLPLRTLVESPEILYSSYWFCSLTRYPLTPTPPPEIFGDSFLLRHAMPLGCLDPQYD
jgi:hypothetical protein